MSSRRHGSLSRSAPLGLCLPFCPPATRGYTSASFTAVERILQKLESVFCCQMRHNFVGVFISFFYSVVFRFPTGQGIFLFSKANKMSSGWRVSMAVCLEMKCLEREAGHPLRTSTDIRSFWIYTCTSTYVFMAWDLIMHRDKLNLFYIP